MRLGAGRPAPSESFLEYLATELTLDSTGTIDL